MQFNIKLPLDSKIRVSSIVVIFINRSFKMRPNQLQDDYLLRHYGLGGGTMSATTLKHIDI